MSRSLRPFAGSRRPGDRSTTRRVGTAGALALALMLSACGGSDAADSPSVSPVAAVGSESAALASRGASSNESATLPSENTASTDAAGPPATEGGVLTFAVANDPINLNPSATGSGNDTLYVTRQLFDSLTEQDPATGEVIPWLAKSFQASQDARSFEFTLQGGVTFSDGTALTAESVKATFDDIAAAGANAASGIVALTGYRETEITGPLSFTVHFNQPNGSFLQAASTVALAPVSPATLAIPYDERGNGAGLIGTGPFVLDHYTKDTEVVLTKRADYRWGPGDRTNSGAAHLDQVVFKIVPESGVRTGSLSSGQVQVIGGVAPQDIAGLVDAGFGTVIRANPGITFGLSANETRPLVSDLAVRQAIAAAINPTDVRDTALNDHFNVASSALAANTPGWVDLSGRIVSDPAKAGQLLDDAGWEVGDDGIRVKDGTPLHLVVGYIGNFGPNQTALELIQQQLKDVGIDIELWTGTVPDFLAAQKESRFDLSWGNLSRADADVLRTSFSVTATNYYQVDDADLEAALVGQQSTADPAKRAAFQATAQEILLDKAYQIPVHELTTVLGTSPSVHGVVLGADSRLSQLTDAFVTP